MNDILETIWNLPWYKIVVIAAADDAILFIKLWWMWLIFGIIAIGFVIAAQVKQWKSKNIL